MILAAVLCLAGCRNVADKVALTTFKVESVQPQGLKAVNAMLLVGIVNPVMDVKVHDVSGCVKARGRKVGTIEVEPFIVDGHRESISRVAARFVLDDNVSLLTLLAVVSNYRSADVTLDLDFKVSPKGTKISKSFSYRDESVLELLGMAQEK